jgi:ComF family protein
LVVPVPLHRDRLAERGFNQSALLAGRLAWHCRAPFAARALIRLRDTPRQANLDRATRLANVTGAFVVRRRDMVQGRSVLLVDDVRTTGATIQDCTRALLEAGARTIASAVVAAAPQPGP